MRKETREKRQTEIETTAYTILERSGVAGATMQAIAKQSGASLETLYNWYGDKLGLFRALVEKNADSVRGLLQACLEEEDDPLKTLHELGPALLHLLTSERVVALNRAAASDTTGKLGRVISEAGRDTVAPLIKSLFKKLVEAREFGGENHEELAETYLSLLLGDIQIRCVVGRMPPLTERECEEQSRRTVILMRRLYPFGDPGRNAARSAV